ncbi:MAG: recombination protein O N-terminal domain-containing protein [Minisyncoccia bacterium]|jgi:recombinational DNA repair protein (RecF pathway)
MEEYVSKALVLTKDPRGERDARYGLFTERFGKVMGKTTSSRSIKSKLAGHLEPGTIANVRFIEKGGVQVVDALKSSRVEISLENLGLLRDLLPDMQAEPELWADLTQRSFSWSDVLRTLGWDPRGALCAICGRKATWFFVSRQEFLCDSCVSKMGRNKISYIRVNS